VAFWSGDKIKAEFSEPSTIVRPYHHSKVDCSAYTLTLGEECFITPDQDTKLRDNMRIKLQEPQTEEHNGIQSKTGGGSVVIPAGQFAFLLTEEFLDIPENVMGFISLKSKVKWKGLINVSGFHVDPGFRGKLVYSVYNAGPTPINLSRGQDLFLLWLADLDQSATSANSRAGKLPSLEISNELISNVNARILSLQDLSRRLDEIDQKFERYRNYLVAFLAGAALVISAFKYFEQPTKNLAQPTASKELTKQDEIPKPPAAAPQKSDASPAPEGASVRRP
jgi:dCTP deaminase